jgi:hypothetical protein
MRMRPCYLDCHEDGLCCYLVLHIENLLRHYSCFSSICDLFMDSPSQLVIILRIMQHKYTLWLKGRFLES